MLLIIILSLYPGIEILEGLYSVSLDALNAYNTRGKSRLNRGEIPCKIGVSWKFPFKISLKSIVRDGYTLPNDSRQLLKASHKGLEGRRHSVRQLDLLRRGAHGWNG